MTILTRSLFYYGFIIDDTNNSLDFSEGSFQLNGNANIGDYTFTSLCLTEVARLMNATGGQEYTVSINRITRLVTISAPANFELLINSGTRVGITIFTLLGFTGADLTGSNSYTGNLPAGSEYRPQKVLDDYLDPANNEGAVDAAINESGSGVIQVFSFGEKVVTIFNIKNITKLPQGNGSDIEENLTGVTDANLFMRNAITKARLEFMPDRNDQSTFYNIFLDKTRQSRQGTDYRLEKMYKIGVEGYFETKTLTWRVLESV